jgi:hypothetical protein
VRAEDLHVGLLVGDQPPSGLSQAKQGAAHCGEVEQDRLTADGVKVPRTHQDQGDGSTNDGTSQRVIH